MILQLINSFGVKLMLIHSYSVLNLQAIYMFSWISAFLFGHTHTHTQKKSCPFSHENQKLCFLVPTLYGQLYFPYNVGICSSHMGNHLSNMLKSLNTILWSIILKTCFKEWRHLLFPKVRTIILLHCNISLQGMFDSMYGLGMRGLTMKAHDTDTDIMKDFWEGWQAFQLLEEWR